MKRPLAAALALVALPATALAVLPAGGGTVDLATTFDGKLRGDVELLGNVAAAGDFTGDKGADLAVVQKSPRAVRLVHGATAGGERGFNATTSTLITSASRTVTTVAGAGDVNGDGLADLVIGSCDPATADDGRAWVVFGRAGTAAIDLDAAGFGGFVVQGPAGSGGCYGRSVAGAGDFNGDGKGDVIVGAHKASSNAGGALLVLGPNGTTSFALTGTGDSRAGTFVAGLGDVNGDGRADVGIGAPDYDDNATVEAGAVFVVFGRTDTTPIALTSLGSAGFRIVGGGDGAHAGPVAPAGDVNKDGKADVAVGAPGPNQQGVVGVLFGTTDTAQKTTASFGPGGYRFRDTTNANRFGFDVRGGFDVNGDGIPDVLAGAPDSSVGTSPEKLRAGKAYVLFGRATGDNVTNVGDPAFDTQGIEILGTRGEQTGAQTQDPTLIGFEGWLGMGDVTCDGAADVLLGTGAARIAGGGTDPGAVFVLRGNGGTPGSCGGAAPTPTPAPTVTPPPGTDGKVVQITRARLKNRRMRVGRGATAISSARKPPPFGTIVRYSISEPATMRFRITCRSPKGKQKAFCKKLARKDTLTRVVRTAGESTLAFSGRIGRKALLPGGYRMTLVAVDPDGASSPRGLNFTVVSR